MEKLKSRLAQASKVEWAKGIAAVVVYILFIVWVQNFWWLFLTPFFFDAFVTKFIPWDWWKNIKNKTFRAIMGWVDAILFALIAVYFVFAFLFQNFTIPTSSLEKTLLVGDFLTVSKFTYGPRVPMTPLSFPLAQHTMPVIGTKSYIERPQWEYRRLRGLRNIEKNDIVVFNFPAGDTVALLRQNEDYHALVHRYGRNEVWNNRARFGRIVHRPVDRRENYVKRCVALPGNVFEIRDRQIYINGVQQPQIETIQHNYFIQTDGTTLNREMLRRLGISNDDFQFHPNGIRADIATFLGFQQGKPVYHLPLTQAMRTTLENVPGVVSIVVEPSEFGGEVFPLGANFGWNRDNFGPIYIPQRGSRLELTLENLPIYERLIRVYEGNALEVRNDIIYINNSPANYYIVQMNYFWMMGDNRHNSLDSRHWGFVPEDHIVGTPLFVWLSIDRDRGWFEGRIRWNRFFKRAGR